VNQDQATKAIEDSLGEVAPDADLAGLARDADIRDALELDSLDFLSFIEKLSKRVGQRIDEDDYPKLVSMASATAFIAGRAAHPASGTA
jgi:acyl carrier protein